MTDYQKSFKFSQIDCEPLSIDVEIVAVDEHGDCINPPLSAINLGFLLNPEHPTNRRLCVFDKKWIPLQHKYFLINGQTFLNPKPEEIFKKKDNKSPDL